jgi:Icc protein
VPGEHDALDDGLTGYLKNFDHDGKQRAWYSFDQNGVHFIGLSNVLNFKMGTMTSLGDEQLAWLKKDLAGVSKSTPIVVLAHIPMWTVYAQWGWGTADADQAIAMLKPFGSVTVLNGHIHQVLQKVEGNVALHTAMSLAYPLPTPGQEGIGEPGPVKVPAERLGKLIGTREITLVRGKHNLALIDTPIDHA